MIKREIYTKLLNGFFYFGSSIVALLFSLFTFPIYSSYLSVEDFGLIGYFASLASFIAPLFNLSLSNFYLMKFFKQNEEQNKKDLFNIIFYLSINNVIISVLFMFIGYYYFNLTNVSYPFFPFFILMLGTAFFEPYKMFLLQQYRIRKQGFMFFLFSALAPIVNAFFSLLLIIVFDLGVFGRMAGMTLSAFVLGVVFIIFLRKFVKPNFSFNDFIGKLKSMIPMIIAGYAYIPIETIDRLFLEKLKMPKEFGLYSIGLQLSGFFLMAATALFKAFEPNIFQAVINKDKIKLIKEIKQYYIVLVIGFIIFFSMLEPMVNILTKGKFIDALPYVRYLSVAKFISAISLVLSAILLAKQRIKHSSYVVYIVSLSSILLYYFSINEYQYNCVILSRILVPLINILALIFFINKKNK